MSTPGARLLTMRRRPKPRPKPRPRPRIVEVTNTWAVTPEGNLRRVMVRLEDDTLVARLLPDEHPALVRFLERAAAAAVTA
jgi:hypothetical protein